MVIDGQRNQKGVQTLGTEFQDSVAAGHGHMLYHTNGRVYCVFARNYLNAVQERRLYISYTTDGGTTWVAPTQLTSGHWDDNPGTIQLDTSSTTSDIGVVFTRATAPDAVNDQILYRIGVNRSTLALTTPVDAVTSSPADFKFPSIVKTAAGYAIFAVSSSYTSSASVTRWENTSFTNNTWSSTTLSNFWGSSTLNPFSLSIKPLAGGQLGAVGVVRTALNGSTSASVGNLPLGIVRTDVYVAFSSDYGVTWSTPQNLTGYAGTPNLDLSGLTVALDADMVQLSNGDIVVAYQEGSTPQLISSATTLAVGGSSGVITSAVYHSTKNLLIVGTDDVTNGGVWVFDLTGQTVTHLNTASTPSIWGNSVQALALSSDNKYLAVAHAQGLEILDTTNSSIASWTNTPIRSSTSPASLVSSMRYCKFASSGYTLYVSYGAQSSTNVWGFSVDASSVGTITNLMSATGGGLSNVMFVVTPSGLYSIPLAGYIEKTNASSGLNITSTNFSGGSWTSIAYDDLNGELVVAGTTGSVNGIHRVTIGSPFTIAASFSTSTNPAVPSTIDVQSFIPVPGSGLYYHAGASGAVSEGFYSFGQRQPVGYLTMARFDQSLGENQFAFNQPGFAILKSSGWRFSSNQGSAVFIDLVHSGRLRYGFFGYDSVGKQLITSGVDFYDMVNTSRVGVASTKLQKFRFTADNTDVLYLYARKADLSATSHQYSAVNGFVEPDAYKLFMQARIRKSESDSLTMKSRIRVLTTQNLTLKCRIVFAQCLKMRARIVPISTERLTMRSRIRGAKETSLANDYYVSTAQESSLRMVFVAGRGNFTVQGLTMRAKISKARQARVTNYFIVYNVQSGLPSVQFAVDSASYQYLSMRAHIVKP